MDNCGDSSSGNHFGNASRMCAPRLSDRLQWNPDSSRPLSCDASAYRFCE